MNEHLPPASAENQEKTLSLSNNQLADAKWSKNKIDQFGLTEAKLNECGHQLGMTETISLADKTSVYHFVHSLQGKLRDLPGIAQQFDDKIGALQDDRFGPVTYRALEIALNQQNAKGLMAEVETGLNKRLPKTNTETKADGTTDANKPTPTLRKPEKQGPWDASFKWKKPKKGEKQEVKTPYDVSCNVRSGEPMWTIGSSSAYGLEKQTGYGSIGAIGANPDSFYKLLTKQIWPNLEQTGIKPPATVVITGLGTNGLTSSDNPKKIAASVASNLAGYQKIGAFLESKGVPVVKNATLNPYGKKIAAIDAFNNALRQNASTCVDTNRAVAGADGKSFKPGYAAKDKLHLSGRGKQDYAAVIQQAA